MSPIIWGRPTWAFIHTLAEKIKETSFPLIGSQLIGAIIQICNHLPCPECAQHAKQFWAKVNIGNIRNREDLINILFVFHNMVNKRKRYNSFKYVDLQYYKSRNVTETYNSFAKNFNTNGNMNLINESFHRNRMLASLKKWVMVNLGHYNL
jgi:hypothetical protein